MQGQGQGQRVNSWGQGVPTTTSLPLCQNLIVHIFQFISVTSYNIYIYILCFIYFTKVVALNSPSGADVLLRTYSTNQHHMRLKDSVTLWLNSSKLQKFTVDSDMLVTFQEHQVWQHLVPHSSPVWSHEETTVTKHTFNRCRCSRCTEDFLKQAVQDGELCFLLHSFPRICQEASALLTYEAQVVFREWERDG